MGALMTPAGPPGGAVTFAASGRSREGAPSAGELWGAWGGGGDCRGRGGGVSAGCGELSLQPQP